jgi:integral membrane sensor domain MASE1
MLATVFVVFFERTAPGSGELLKKNLTGSNMLWVANGILLAYLLMAPRWRWPGYLVAAVLALVTGNVIIHESWRMNLLYNVLDIAEVLIAAQLMRGRTAQLPRFTDHSYLIRFFAFAVLAAPLAVSIIYALIMAWWTSLPLLKGFLSWACSESLGILVITPLCVAIFQSNFFDLRYWRKNGFLVALTAICAICAFSFGSLSAAGCRHSARRPGLGRPHPVAGRHCLQLVYHPGPGVVCRCLVHHHGWILCLAANVCRHRHVHAL